jgi:CHAT domain-containing protein
VLDSVPLSDVLAHELDLDPIRFGEQEGGRIAAAHDARRRTGAEAGLATLREELARAPAGIVHLQAHAVTSDPNPSAALLLLADGIADMPQLARVPFAGALVVLSACQSAGGRVQAGEGTLGLLCGVFGGGARGAVAALHDVNQQATADLMAQFHTRLAAGDDPAEAMRAARGVLAAAQQYAHPYYWAGFGVYAPPQEEPGSLWRWLLAGGALLGLLLLVLALARRGARA